MERKELDEAMTVMGIALDGLLATITGPAGTSGAQTRYLCGWTRANGRSLLGAGGFSFWTVLAACFEIATQGGATFETMDKVRETAEALSPSLPAAIAARNFTVRMSLAQEARILAATEFKSRQDVDRYFDRINASFDRAELLAADNLDNVSYTLLVKIHAAVSNDLANRARPLPRMVTVTLPQSKPSLNIAQRLYGDANRNAELIDENKPIHPLFMQRTIEALSD
jgi:prophage DNA circulation protein